jgi:hypothetical protein
MKFNEVKGVRFQLYEEHAEDEIVLSEPYEYVKIEGIKSIANYNIAVYINDAREDEYICFEDSIAFEDIEVKKVRVKLLNAMMDKEVQVTLMR